MLRWLDLKNIFIWLGFSHFFKMLSFLDFFLLRDGRLLEAHAPATWHRISWKFLTMYARWSIENSGRCTCTPRGVLIEVSNEWFTRRDLPTEEEKTTNKENIQGIGFWVKIQRGITLEILNEIIRFKGLFVCWNTIINWGGGVLNHCHILNF